MVKNAIHASSKGAYAMTPPDDDGYFFGDRHDDRYEPRRGDDAGALGLMMPAPPSPHGRRRNDPLPPP